MSKITYKVVKHDGGRAYEANGTFSVPFRTREVARAAPKLAASEQAALYETTEITYEDDKGTGTTRSTAAPIPRRPSSKIE